MSDPSAIIWRYQQTENYGIQIIYVRYIDNVKKRTYQIPHHTSQHSICVKIFVKYYSIVVNIDHSKCVTLSVSTTLIILQSYKKNDVSYVDKCQQHLHNVQETTDDYAKITWQKYT